MHRWWVGHEFCPQSSVDRRLRSKWGMYEWLIPDRVAKLGFILSFVTTTTCQRPSGRSVLLQVVSSTYPIINIDYLAIKNHALLVAVMQMQPRKSLKYRRSPSSPGVLMHVVVYQWYLTWLQCFTWLDLSAIGLFYIGRYGAAPRSSWWVSSPNKSFISGWFHSHHRSLSKQDCIKPAGAILSFFRPG